jgi:hypothetical protein
VPTMRNKGVTAKAVTPFYKILFICPKRQSFT